MQWDFISIPDQTWANYLLNNFYFLALAIGASFFMALQYITQSGWSSGFKRVPEAMASYIPVAALFFLILYFGIHAIYHWSDPEADQRQMKLSSIRSPYLNLPFFMIRIRHLFWLLDNHDPYSAKDFHLRRIWKAG